MKLRLFLTTLSLSAAAVSYAQSSDIPPHRTCGSYEHLQQQLASDPFMAQRRQEMEDFTTQFMARNPQTAGKGTQVVYNIPVVVHVLYNNSTSNISDAQILSQLEVLNQDYQLLNADNSTVPAAFAGLKADCQINFCLAQRDPSGNPTTGILRVSTTKSSFSSSSDNAKHTSTGGHDAWPQSSYLNIWVVPGIDAGNVLGYAQFPGGPAATDGVVIGHKFFGTTGTATAPYNKGRTATHEVGHWLNLYHIWGDDGTACTGSDLVGDTPNQGSENYGCPSFPKISCSNGPNGDMFMNYMDYVDDACMKMFSTGQKSRMHAVLASGGSRASLAASLGCTPPSGSVCSAPSGQSAGSVTTTGAVISWAAVSGAVSYNLQWKESSAGTWNTVSGITASSYSLTGLTAATTYNYQVATNCSGDASSYTAPASFTTLSATGSCNAPTGLAMDNLTATAATVSWSPVSGATAYEISYRKTSTSTWTTVSNIATTSYTISELSAGTAYYIRFRTQCGGSTYSAYTATYTFTTNAAATCTNNYEPNNSMSAAVTVAPNTTVKSMIGSKNDPDYFKVSTTSASPKLKVTLTTLPKDYDLKLYNSAGSLLATSQAGGTTSEAITYNASAAGTYYIYVYGYGGVYSASSCYTLSTETSASNFRLENPGTDLAKTNLSIFPNPSKGEVSLEYYATSSQQANIQVYDQSGRVVWTGAREFQEGSNQTTLSLSQLSAGIYFIRLTTGEEVRTGKVMIQR